MAKIIWTEKFSVQNDEIDEQHKKWIEIYNKAHERMMNYSKLEDTIGIGKDALKDMIEYGKYHFSFEEKFMEEIRFSGIDEHKKIHEAFTKKLDLLALEMQNEVLVLNSEVIKVIENWLVDHILVEDQKYVN
ncbi:MAG: hemerythrin family protein [Desulfobacteraceae bacterium]|nr:hemerythrin family protein [Desulfobacteraceae bacterium]